MFHRLTLAAALALAATLSACSPVTTNYLGNTYQSTQQVEVFFAARDIERPYKVMGIAEMIAPDGTDTDKFFDSIVKTARQRGADAVLVQGMNRQPIGSAGGGGGAGAGWHEGPVRVHANAGGGTTQALMDRIVRAQFLKYQSEK